MIFGVAARRTMLSSERERSKKVMASSNRLGVATSSWKPRNPTMAGIAKVRKNSPGLTLSDYQISRKNVSDIKEARRANGFTPGQFPKPQQDTPDVYGVEQVIWR